MAFSGKALGSSSPAYAHSAVSNQMLVTTTFLQQPTCSAFLIRNTAAAGDNARSAGPRAGQGCSMSENRGSGSGANEQQPGGSSATARLLASSCLKTGVERIEDGREAWRDLCCIAQIPEALLASILLFIPQKERLRVASLVCKQWRSLVRGNLCQADTTIRIVPAFLSSLKRLPQATQRASIKAIAALSRSAKLVIDHSDVLHPDVHGGPSELRMLQALLLELRDVRFLSISILCPIGARLLGKSLALVLQRSAGSLVELEIGGDDLTQAALGALLSTPLPSWEGSSQVEIADAFLSCAAALEASVGARGHRDGSYEGRVGKGVAGRESLGMLMATARLLKPEATRGAVSPPVQTRTHAHVESQRQRSTLQDQQRLPREDEVRTSDARPIRDGAQRSFLPRGACCRRERQGDSGGALPLRERVAAIVSCCCCVAAARAAFGLNRSFDLVRLVLPRLRSLTVGDWRLLQALHCPCLEVLRLAQRTEIQPRTSVEIQLQQQLGFPHTTTDGTPLLSVAGDRMEPGGVHEYSVSALHDLLCFLLRSGSNLRRLEGLYPSNAVNDILLHYIASAEADLCGSSQAAVRGEACTPPEAAVDAATSSIDSAGESRHARARPAFGTTAMAAADAFLHQLTRPFSSSESDAHVTAGAKQHSLPPLHAPSSNIANLKSALTKAMAAAEAAASEDCSLPLEYRESTIASAAVHCVLVGGGCRHRAHPRDSCCAVPCTWSVQGHLRLVLLPRLRVVELSDVLLLGFLLLPRLEELKLPEMYDSLTGNRSGGFALLWAYLSVYGGGLRALRARGTAPPLAAFFGAGSSEEPLLSAARPNEAAAAKALRLMLRRHRAHPLMDPASVSADSAAACSPSTGTPGEAATARVSTAPCARAAGLPENAQSASCLGRSLASRHEHQQQQARQRPPIGETQHHKCRARSAGVEEEVMHAEDEIGPRTISRLLSLQARGFKNGLPGPATERIHYGLKFGQLRHLQCHSTFLPYLAEPLPQCGLLQSLTTEGEADEVLWFVALFRTLKSVCVKCPSVITTRRRPRALEENTLVEEEVGNDSSSSTHFVTLAIRNYVGTAVFFGPHVRCPSLRQMQAQRRDDDIDTFLLGGGAPNLQVLRYYGYLFGGRGVSTLRALVASHEMRMLRGTAEGEEKVQQLLQLLRLPRCFSPLKESPFTNLRELHVWTLDARTVMHLAFATAAATDPQLSVAWQQVLWHRKEERNFQLHKSCLVQRKHGPREKEKSRLIVEQRRLYEAYTSMRRRLRRMRSALAVEQQAPSAASHRPAGQLMNRVTLLWADVECMRKELRVLQERLEALAAEDSRASASAGDARTRQEQQLLRHQRLQRDPQRRQGLPSPNQRLVELRRLLQISARDFSPHLSRAVGEGTEPARPGEVTRGRRRARQHRGQEGDFECTRSWCFWACHRAVAAVSQLLPQLRMCVVQQLRGNSSSLHLLLRGLPRLEVFAVEDSPRGIRKQRLLRLANHLGFTVRRGSLDIHKLRSSLISWETPTVSRPFRILSRSPAGARASATSLAAADMLTHALLGRYNKDSTVLSALKQRSMSQAASPMTAADAASPSHSLQEVSPRAAGTSSVEHRAAEREGPVRSVEFRAEVASCLEGVRNQVATAWLPARFTAASGGQKDWASLALPSLRCSLYSRKRRRKSSESHGQTPTLKRQSCSRSGAGGRPPELARQDLQLAKCLAKELEEQLTS
ncbi:hypothetical protein ACSSS7_001797 [Eimeria intestinalis]